MQGVIYYPLKGRPLNMSQLLNEYVIAVVK